MLDVGTEAPDFTLKDQNGQPVTLSDFRGAKNVLLVFFPLAFTGICQGELDEIRDHLPTTRTTTPPRWRSRWGRRRPTRSGRRRAASPFPVLSDFWPHGAVARPTACSTTTPASPTAARSSSTASGIIRFAEMKQPGEPRDQAVWTDALGGAAVGLTDFRVAASSAV